MIHTRKMKFQFGDAREERGAVAYDLDYDGNAIVGLEAACTILSAWVAQSPDSRSFSAPEDDEIVQGRDAIVVALNYAGTMALTDVRENEGGYSISALSQAMRHESWYGLAIDEPEPEVYAKALSAVEDSLNAWLGENEPEKDGLWFSTEQVEAFGVLILSKAMAE